MKVRELIERLQREDPEAVVFTQGCDCNGEVGGIERGRGALDDDGEVWHSDTPNVLLTRP